jgi:hypothetical protein
MNLLFISYIYLLNILLFFINKLLILYLGLKNYVDMVPIYFYRIHL